MDNWNIYIALMTGRDSKKPCCAPLFESLGYFAWLYSENLSDRVFMTNGIDIDQNQNILERGLCSSSISSTLENGNGRQTVSCLPSSDLQMELKQNWNCNKKVYQTERQVFNVNKRYHSTIHQSCLDTTALISVALMKENLFAVVSLDQRL
jgi:hypothetical protein